MTLNLENAFWSKYPPHMQMSYVNLTVGQMGFSYVFVYLFFVFMYLCIFFTKLFFAHATVIREIDGRPGGVPCVEKLAPVWSVWLVDVVLHWWLVYLLSGPLLYFLFSNDDRLSGYQHSIQNNHWSAFNNIGRHMICELIAFSGKNGQFCIFCCDFNHR